MIRPRFDKQEALYRLLAFDHGWILGRDLGINYLSRDLVADDVRLRFLMLPGVPPGDSSPPPPPSGVDGLVATSRVSTRAVEAAGESGPAGVFSPLPAADLLAVTSEEADLAAAALAAVVRGAHPLDVRPAQRRLLMWKRQ